MALLVILALLWGVALLPGALRARRDAVHSSVGGFNRTMSVLRNRALTRPVTVRAQRIHTVVAPSLRTSPGGRARMLARRRRLLVALLAGNLAAAAAGALGGGLVWLGFGVTASTLAAYVASLRVYERRWRQYVEVVRPLGIPQEIVVQPDAAEWSVVGEPAEPVAVAGSGVGGTVRSGSGGGGTVRSGASGTSVVGGAVRAGASGWSVADEPVERVAAQG